MSNLFFFLCPKIFKLLALKFARKEFHCLFLPSVPGTPFIQGATSILVIRIEGAIASIQRFSQYSWSFLVNNFPKRQKDLKYFHIEVWNGWFPTRTIEYWLKKVFFILHQFLNFMPIFWSTEVSIVIPNIYYLKIQFYTVYTRDVSNEVTIKFLGSAFYTETERQLKKEVLLFR